MKDFRFDPDVSAIRDLAFAEETEQLVQDVGDHVAHTAASLAPKATGAGAESIHAETARDADSVYAIVSWDQDHFYMLFPEVGTEHQPPRPFLRPALEQSRI